MDGKYQKYWVKARIPEKYQFRTKTQMVLDMIKDVYESGLPFGQATGDSVYGADGKVQKCLKEKDKKISDIPEGHIGKARNSGIHCIWGRQDKN